MSTGITLSLDAMGGDAAPEMVVEGVNLSIQDHPDVRFLLYGREGELQPLLDKYPRVKMRAEIRHTEDIVTNDEKPSVALRSGRQSSMRLAINAVADGEASGVVSAGNTGALMAMAKFVLKTLPGISRPAIATVFPTQRGESVMLDLGANVECDAENLVQFAVMGEVFARQVIGIEKPSVGILNIGAEDLKGNTAVKNAHTFLQNSTLPIKFYGFVEGDDIAAGTVDVIVTDGFTGNVALKTAEGTARLFGGFLKQSLMSSLPGRIGAFLAQDALRAFKKRVDPRRYNGAMFLGLNGVCVKSHGGTDALGFAMAINVALGMVRDNLNESIRDDFSKIQNIRETLAKNAEQKAEANG